MKDDAREFGPEALPMLRAAAIDLCWLLERGYPELATLQLVGNRYALSRRQRTAVRRSSCSDRELADRTSRRLDPGALAGRPVLLDGYNVLSTVEAALRGEVLLRARDGSLRDLAGLHGEKDPPEAYRPAFERIGRWLSARGAAGAEWLLDRPVSGSGILRAFLERFAAERGWGWEARVVDDPDPILARAPSPAVVATADSAILDRCADWIALAREVVEVEVPGAWILELAPRSLPPPPRAD